MSEKDVLDDPQTSEWLRNALSSALTCDPVSVANEAVYLSSLLRQRAARSVEDEGA